MSATLGNSVLYVPLSGQQTTTQKAEQTASSTSATSTKAVHDCSSTPDTQKRLDSSNTPLRQRPRLLSRGKMLQ